MSGLSVKKRPLAGSATSRVWEIADEMLRQGGAIPSGRAVVDRYVAEGFNEGTGFTQYSHWKKAHENHFRRPSQPARPGPADGVGHPDGRPHSMPCQTLRVGPDGRLLIPQEMRVAMRLGDSGKVSVWVEAGVLHVRSPQVGLWEAQEIAKQYATPGVSQVETFLGERRAQWGEE